MPRILLDDSGRSGGSSQLGVGSSANDGTGDPLRTGGQKLKLWASDLNTMTAELYQSTPIDLAATPRTVADTESHRVFTNSGMTATLVCNLPAGGSVPLVYHFDRIAGYDIQIDPNGSQQFVGAGAGKYLLMHTEGRVSIAWHVGAAKWRVIGNSAPYDFET